MTSLKKGGSGRKFYRIRFKQGISVILVQYTQEREENAHYVDIAKFLTETGVRVPSVHFHEPTSGLILMQDLGEEDLWSYRESSWEVRRPLYEAALSEVFLIHQEPIENLLERNLKMGLEFDEQLYLWEQNYFFENCVKSVWGLDTQGLRKLPALQEMAARLSRLPRVLVHRDFQSQNILISAGKSWLIDFQGMRPGLGLYDVASLLYDPYVNLSNEERQGLLKFYKGLVGDASAENHLETIFFMCAAQRLMQALGAYGFLGLKKRRKDFLKHIPAARRLLREVALNCGGLDFLVETLDKAA